ncbi:MAG: PQQ-binding-like beta-propeller repeat protein [Verrucomicrobia bacterium]|nr:PQQ-binding-like beta-propeller repeat protein [Verrucomicrobiota bacterium]MBI3871119.1 PQQ-binding-like beta-propeller repeat protein [Verrucomicrobiota bacterium]
MKRSAILLRLPPLLFFASLLGLIPGLAQENWTQFRGPQGNGLSHARQLPVSWSETNHVAWKTAIHGKGWSSPVIWSNQIWITTATPDGRELSVMRLDRASGKVTLDQKLYDIEKPQYADRFNSYASPTPAIEEGRVYVSFGSPGTACLDAETGKVLWERRDFVCNHFRGAASSPVPFLDRLLLHFDGSDKQYVVALDKKTGKTLWETDRSVDYKDIKADGKPDAGGDWRKGFSTPTVTLYGNQFTVLSLGSKAFYAYDLTTGQELWRTEEPTSHSGTVRPVAALGMVFVCTGLSKGQLWAIKPGGSGVVTDTRVAWKVTRNVPTRPSPVVVGDLLFMIDDGGIASCLEAKTGNEIWRERLEGNYSASPIAAAGRLYFLNQEGKTSVVRASRQFKVEATNYLEDGFMASPAVYGKALYLRTRSHLYRIED